MLENITESDLINIEKYLKDINKLNQDTIKKNKKWNKIGLPLDIPLFKLEENDIIYFNEKTQKYHIRNKYINKIKNKR